MPSDLQTSHHCLNQLKMKLQFCLDSREHETRSQTQSEIHTTQQSSSVSLVSAVGLDQEEMLTG